MKPKIKPSKGGWGFVQVCAQLLPAAREKCAEIRHHNPSSSSSSENHNHNHCSRHKITTRPRRPCHYCHNNHNLYPSHKITIIISVLIRALSHRYFVQISAQNLSQIPNVCVKVCTKQTQKTRIRDKMRFTTKRA